MKKHCHPVSSFLEQEIEKEIHSKKLKKVNRSTKLKKRTKLKPEQFEQLAGTAEAHKYKQQEDGTYLLNLKRTQALAKAWQRAEKFVLRIDAELKKRYYLTEDLLLVVKPKEAIKFALGFDTPDNVVYRYETITGLKLKMERIGKPIKPEKENVEN